MINFDMFGYDLPVAFFIKIDTRSGMPGYQAFGKAVNSNTFDDDIVIIRIVVPIACYPDQVALMLPGKYQNK